MKSAPHFVLILALILGFSVASADDTLQIGSIFPMSGDAAPYGEWAANGAQLAIEKVNADSQFQIKNIVEDCKGKPADAVTSYRRLRDTKGVTIVLTEMSSVALAISPLANKDRVVQMDVSASTPEYSSPDDNTFRTGIIATQLGGDMAEIVSKQFGVSRIGILYIDNAKGLAGYESFKRKFSGDIPVVESFRESETDYKPLLTKLMSKRIADVWISGHMKETALIIKQAAEMNFRPRWLSDVYSIEGAEFLDTAKELSDGIIYISPVFDPKSSDPVVVSFVKGYQTRFKEAPNYFAAQAYDGIMAIAAAAEKCFPEKRTECIKDELYALDFEGASGRIKFDRFGDVVKSTELKVVRNGKFVRYERSDDKANN